MAFTTEITAAITAQNTGTSYVRCSKGDTIEVGVGAGGGATTIHLQRKLTDGDGTIHDVKTYLPGSPPEIIHGENDWQYRLFVKTGNFGSGTANLYIWQT